MKVPETNTVVFHWTAFLIMLRWLCYLAYTFLKKKGKKGKSSSLPFLTHLYGYEKGISDTSLAYKDGQKTGMRYFQLLFIINNQTSDDT